MTVQKRGRATVLALSGLLITSLAACGSDDSASSDDGGGGGDSEASSEAFSIGLLLPESKTARYEAFDRPLFEEAIKEDCPDCTIVYSNADQDAVQQQEQAEAALAQGVDLSLIHI